MKTYQDADYFLDGLTEHEQGFIYTLINKYYVTTVKEKYLSVITGKIGASATVFMEVHPGLLMQITAVFTRKPDGTVGYQLIKAVTYQTLEEFNIGRNKHLEEVKKNGKDCTDINGEQFINSD